MKKEDDPTYIPSMMSDSDDMSPTRSPERRKRASARAAVKNIKKAARDIMNTHRSNQTTVVATPDGKPQHFLPGSPSKLPQGLVAVPQNVAKLPQGYVALPQSGKKSGKNVSLLATALQSSGITPVQTGAATSQIKTAVGKPKDFLATIQVGSTATNETHVVYKKAGMS